MLAWLMNLDFAGGRGILLSAEINISDTKIYNLVIMDTVLIDLVVVGDIFENAEICVIDSNLYDLSLDTTLVIDLVISDEFKE